MQRRFARALLIILIAAGLADTAALAQQGGERSAFVAFLEKLISTPDRRVSLSGLEGAFSATPTVERIAVSDRDGPWLEIEGVEIVWKRSALLDRRLQIDSLRARRVALLRKPHHPPERPDSGGGFPGLPIEVAIDAVSLPFIVLAPPVAGAQAELAAAGSAQLTEEALAAQLSVFRQDRAGTLTVELRLEPDANVLAADLTLEEPAGGIVAELLDLSGRPPISVRLSGQGPLASWDATLEASAGTEKVLEGSMAVSRIGSGYRAVTDMVASLEDLAPSGYATLLAGESRLTLDVSLADGGSVTIEEARLRSDGVDFTGRAELARDLVPESAVLALRLGQAGRAALPFAPGDASVASLQINAELERGVSAPWRLGVVAEGVRSTFGSFARLTLNASGEAEDLGRSSSRSVDFTGSGTLSGLAPADADLRVALGSELRFAAEGSWSAGRPVDVANLQIVLNDAAASFAGAATADRLDGSFGATIGDLSRLSGLAGRALAGSAQLTASGTAAMDGRFDLRIEGETVDLALAIAALDPLLAGATTVSGGIARSEGAVSFDDMVLANDRVTAQIDGSVSEPGLSLAVTADIADLSLVSERAAGRARVSAQLTGSTTAPRVEAEASGEEIVLMGRPLTDAAIRFSGVVAGPDTAGEAQLSGALAGEPVSGSGRLSAGEEGARRVEDLTFKVAESRVSGDMAIGADGLFTGSISVVSPDLSKVAPLLLVEASGMLRAEIDLAVQNGSQSAAISGTAADVVYENVAVETADFQGRARDLFAAPQIEGDFSLRNLKAGGLTIVSAVGTAERSGIATAFTADAELADGRATIEATLEPREGGLAIGLGSFSFVRRGVDFALASPVTIVVANDAAEFDDTTLNFGGGSAAISGRAGETLDLTIDLDGIPAALANNFSPGLGAEGTISGRATIGGTASEPVARFDVRMAGASVAASRNAGIGPLAVAAEGDYGDGRVQLTSLFSGADGLTVNVSGTVGTADGAPLDFSINGAVPLSLGNRQLAARGSALRGALDVDIRVTGTAAAPQFAGRVTSEGGGFVDPRSGIVLSDLSVAAAVSNNRLVIERLNAASGEGTVAAEGSLGLDPNEGLPVDMRINVSQARYVDGSLIAARFDADLTLTGLLTEAPLLTGSVFLDRTEITVPERLPGDSVAVDVEHVVPPPTVERTLQTIRERESRAQGQGRGTGPSGIRLEVTVNAPRQIFVRGRGLDTEFGGQLILTGSVSSVVTAGSFELVRGRLDILTQRIVLDRGTITFAGDLDPMLDFIGSTQSGDVTITVTITGRASDPEVIFSSVPQLPQDEILAQLIFQKGLGELSAFQIARLAAAASELSGGSGGGILSQLRARTGLDDLDIVVDEEGEAALAAGRYIGENVYLGVQQGTNAQSSRVTIDLDITRNVKARAGYSVEGESSLGIFFEREY